MTLGKSENNSPEMLSLNCIQKTPKLETEQLHFTSKRSFKIHADQMILCVCVSGSGEEESERVDFTGMWQVGEWLSVPLTHTIETIRTGSGRGPLFFADRRRGHGKLRMALQ
jgi:hypothetical protein